MALVGDFQRRRAIIQEIVRNLGMFEDEIKLEIEKVKESETALRNQQLDIYLMSQGSVLGGFIMEVKEKIAQSDKLLQELAEEGKKEIDRRGYIP